MKLLGLRIDDHDSSFSYFDGEKFHYLKTERYRQLKKHAIRDLDKWEDVFHKHFGVRASDLDEIAIVFDPWNHDMELANGDNDFFYPSTDGPQGMTRVNHHLAHVLSCQILSDKPYDVAIAIDGFGDKKSTWTVFKDDKVVDRGTLDDNFSFGFAVEDLAEYCEIPHKFQDNAGKVMGLQSYGTLDEGYLEFLQQFDEYQLEDVSDIKHWHSYKGGHDVGKLTKLDFARTVHERLGQLIMKIFKKHCKKDDVIFYSGGVAQNVLWNTDLKREFPNLVIPPHSNDEGLSIGALEYLRQKHGLPPLVLDNFPYSQMDEAPKTEPTMETIKKVAQYLADGKIVAWYQGHGEVGPRALGNRSILFNPAIEGAKDKVNKVKRRERYRPFGASILSEHRDEYFIDLLDNPYMLFVANSVEGMELDGITHVDGTCRVQTVKKDENKHFRALLEEFYKLTGIPVLLNTSLNVAGHPIAGWERDAIKVFKETEVDVAIVGNIVYAKDSL